MLAIQVWVFPMLRLTFAFDSVHGHSLLLVFVSLVLQPRSGFCCYLDQISWLTFVEMKFFQKVFRIFGPYLCHQRYGFYHWPLPSWMIPFQSMHHFCKYHYFFNQIHDIIFISFYNNAIKIQNPYSPRRLLFFGSCFPNGRSTFRNCSRPSLFGW